jgi:myo-inositol-1(or 4)-monophosphatase
VTKLDTLVEETLARELSAAFPEIPVFGEETGVDFSAKTYFLIDPIDGTENFIRGLPFCSHSIALIDRGEPVVALIKNIATKDIYRAAKGQGSEKNGQPICCSDRPFARSMILLEGQPSDTLQDVRQRVEERIFHLPSYAAACIDLAYVAEGKVEGRIRLNGTGQEWDYAAGALLVQEAGGVVRNIDSDTYNFRNLDFIAASPSVYGDIAQIVSQAIGHAAQP